MDRLWEDDLSRLVLTLGSNNHLFLSAISWQFIDPSVDCH